MAEVITVQTLFTSNIYDILSSVLQFLVEICSDLSLF